MSPPLRVPLEVLERILFFAFTPFASPSSSFPLTSKDLVAPPLGTYHLLLVSRGFRRLALPLYYSTIAIVSPLDLPTFLHPEVGLLVGEDNEERTSFVKELWINVAEECEIPIENDLLQDALERHERVEHIIIRLERATLPNLNHLRFFHCGACDHSGSRPGARYVGYTERDPADIWWRVVDEELSEVWLDGAASKLVDADEDVWGPEWQNFLQDGIDRLYRETEIPSPEELEDQLSSERENAPNLFLDSDFPPRRVEVTLDGLSEDFLLQLDSLELFSTSEQPFAVVPPAGQNLETMEDEETAGNSFKTDLERLAFASRHSLLFEGFPRSLWEGVRGHMGDVDWGEGWTWRSEDGTIVSLRETFGRQEV